MTVIDFKAAKDKRKTEPNLDEYQWDLSDVETLADDLIVDIIVALRDLGINHQDHPNFVKDAYVVHIALMSLFSRVKGLDCELNDVVDKLFYEHFGEVPIEELHNVFSVEELPD